MLFFPDIIGKIISKFVGLYTKTKPDKVVCKHERIGVKGQDIARDHNFENNISCLVSVLAFLDQMVTSQPYLPSSVIQHHCIKLMATSHTHTGHLGKPSENFHASPFWLLSSIRSMLFIHPPTPYGPPWHNSFKFAPGPLPWSLLVVPPWHILLVPPRSILLPGPSSWSLLGTSF